MMIPPINAAAMLATTPTDRRISRLLMKGGPEGPPLLRTALRTALLRTALNALRDHCDLPHSAASDDVQRLLVGAGKRRRLRAERRRNGTEVFTLRPEYLHPGHPRPDVYPPVVVDAHAVGIAACEHRELPEVAQRAIGLHVECVDDRSIGRVEHAAVRTQRDTVRPLYLLADRHRLAVGADVDNPLLGAA